MKNKISAFVWVGMLLFQSMVQAGQIHVAIKGEDTHPGTAEKPLASLEAAQKAVRQEIAKGLKEPMEVVLHGGTYFLKATLEFRPEDSGTAACPITWRAADGEKVTLSGGVTIQGGWTKGADRIWSVALPKMGKEWNFRLLFVNEKWATRARFPNVNDSNPFLYATQKGGLDSVIIDPALIKESWGRASDAQMNIVPKSRFFNQWNTVTEVNKETGKISIADSERNRLIDEGSWFWIEGVREELDMPGEWFLDSVKGQLFYIPEEGVDPNTLKFVAPFLNRLINVKGDVNAGTRVKNVHFKGIDFRHTTSTLGHIEPRTHTDTVIMFENTLDCSVKNCHFENIGGYALWLHLDSQRNVFDSNHVENSGAGGVLMTGARFAYLDEKLLYTPGEAASKVAPILNKVTRNLVEHCGRIRYYGGGVHMDSRPLCMAMSPGNYIAHNCFRFLSRNGVFAFRNQGGNVIEYNLIHDALQTTIDGGTIHIATMNHLTSPHYILNNWLYDIRGYSQRPDGKPIRELANGIFLDWDTSNSTVKNNWCYNSPVKESVKSCFNNQNNTIEDNPYSDKPITPPFSKEVGALGTATNSIDLESNRLTGGVIHYTDPTLVQWKGDWKKETLIGMVGLFEFQVLKIAKEYPGEIIYTLPIQEDGKYEISLLYKPAKDNATNAPIAIYHAEEIEKIRWNMQKGNKNGFSVPIGTFSFKAGQPAKIVISNDGSDGIVVADSVGFVKQRSK